MVREGDEGCEERQGGGSEGCEEGREEEVKAVWEGERSRERLGGVRTWRR